MALRGAALGAHARRRIDVEFLGRIWKNDRPDITAFDDQIGIARISAHAMHKKFANAGHGADARNLRVHPIFIQVRREIDAIDEEVKFPVDKLSVEIHAFNESDNPFLIVGIETVFQHRPCNGAIHRARIDVDEAKSAR